ncbi:hypothetical protein [Vagococcus fluvialis]|uniref:hypothetical protein n=1 Tax=Vagococcus fluvialis TaxID=2738 RepID=UPI001D0AE00C|nr:hypothetical protein [Vagococcus fluvialis]UDM72680.1 hypothetical protein K5L00_14930 [Vagococcus fluvialis]UDM78403.1 hypothetical protein K5K98_14265 [Vagococcus fluvialis]UDM83955.1 hypothetical protein K5K96_14955 [Vagococcus fluvialis]
MYQVKDNNDGTVTISRANYERLTRDSTELRRIKIRDVRRLRQRERSMLEIAINEQKIRNEMRRSGKIFGGY